MSDKPTTPADERDEPYYIDNECPDCGTELVLYQEWEDVEYDEDEIWYDEWVCPQCEGGVHMDWPDEKFESLKETGAEADWKPLDTDG